MSEPVIGGRAQVEAQLADERAAKMIAAEAADRFRDVLSEALGHDDENPGDDVLVTELRQHFGKTGPEPRRWRDFCASALAQVDQIEANRRGALDGGHVVTTLREWLAILLLGSRCDICGDRVRGWRTLMAHVYVNHPGEGDDRTRAEIQALPELGDGAS